MIIVCFVYNSAAHFNAQLITSVNTDWSHIIGIHNCQLLCLISCKIMWICNDENMFIHILLILKQQKIDIENITSMGFQNPLNVFISTERMTCDVFLFPN